jgi:O-antigen/teichoic acid export membrane protein
MGNAFVAQRRAHFTMINNLTSSVLELIMVLLFILFLRSFRGIFFAMVFSGAITLIISMRFFLPKILPGFRPVPIISRSVVREMIHFSFTNYIANAVWSFTIYVLPIMVINALGIQANAYFFISWTVGGVLGTISLATTTSLFAEGSFDEKKMVSDIWRCLKLTCIILIPIAVIVFLLADKLLLLFGTAYSLEGTGLLRIMCIAALPLALNSIYMSILRIQKKSIALILLTVFIAIVTLVVSYFLVPRVGIIGTGFGWLISQGVLAIFVLSRLVKLKKQDNLQ